MSAAKSLVDETESSVNVTRNQEARRLDVIADAQAENRKLRESIEISNCLGSEDFEEPPPSVEQYPQVLRFA